jgi:uncharacterized protein YbjT (DUF2867 family)
MYVILGATGHIGSVIAGHLLMKGEKVRAVARNPEKLRLLARKGAETYSADVTDAEPLARAFHGARAAFVMIPPSMTSPDYREEQERVAESIASAVEKSKIQYVVALSSYGAQAAFGTGPIAGLHRFEEKLKRIGAVNVVFLRASFFMENHLTAIPIIQNMGVFGSALRPDLMIPMIATRDIGDYAADQLLKLNFHGKQVQELLGERDLSMSGVTAIVGRAINNPVLRYVQFSYEQVGQALAGMGIPPKTAESFVEMYRGINDGIVVNEEPRSASNTTPTSFETFVQEVFVPASRGKAASA